MRHLVVILFLSPLLFCAKCEKDEVLTSLPEAIQNHIHSTYPNAEVEKAEQEKLCTGVDAIEVEVEPSEDQELEMVFDLQGNWLFTKTEIAESALPASVKNAITSNFPGYHIKESERLDMADGGTQYEVELKKGSTVDVTFDSEGAEICREEE